MKWKKVRNILFRFYDFDKNCGSILTSASHLKELLLTQTPENKVPELSISNYPNPFTENTIINVDIGINDNYVISIFDNKGSLIRILENSFLHPVIILIPGIEKMKMV